MLRKIPHKIEKLFCKRLENRLAVENISKTEAGTSLLNQAFTI